MGELTFKKGDIFSYAGYYDLTIVAGHIGLNELGALWRNFQRRYPEFEKVDNPFMEIGRKFVKLEDSKYIYFMPEEENHGISDDILKRELKAIFVTARKMGIKTIIFNGIRNTNDSIYVGLIESSDEPRIKLIVDFVSRYLKKGFGFKEISLVTLGDDFIKYGYCMEALKEFENVLNSHHYDRSNAFGIMPRGSNFNPIEFRFIESIELRKRQQRLPEEELRKLEKLYNNISDKEKIIRINCVIAWGKGYERSTIQNILMVSDDFIEDAIRDYETFGINGLRN